MADLLEMDDKAEESEETKTLKFNHRKWINSLCAFIYFLTGRLKQITICTVALDSVRAFIFTAGFHSWKSNAEKKADRRSSFDYILFVQCNTFEFQAKIEYIELQKAERTH